MSTSTNAAIASSSAASMSTPIMASTSAATSLSSSSSSMTTSSASASSSSSAQQVQESAQTVLAEIDTHGPLLDNLDNTLALLSSQDQPRVLRADTPPKKGYIETTKKVGCYFLAMVAILATVTGLFYLGMSYAQEIQSGVDACGATLGSANFWYSMLPITAGVLVFGLAYLGFRYRLHRITPHATEQTHHKYALLRAAIFTVVLAALTYGAISWAMDGSPIGSLNSNIIKWWSDNNFKAGFITTLVPLAGIAIYKVGKLMFACLERARIYINERSTARPSAPAANDPLAATQNTTGEAPTEVDDTETNEDVSRTAHDEESDDESVEGNESPPPTAPPGTSPAAPGVFLKPTGSQSNDARSLPANWQQQKPTSQSQSDDGIGLGLGGSKPQNPDPNAPV